MEAPVQLHTLHMPKSGPGDLEIGGMREVKVSSPSIEFSVKETRVVHNA